MKKALQLAQLLQHGMTAHREGRLAEAERSYRAVRDVKQDDFDSLHLLGVARWQQRRHDEASKLIKQALRVRPDSAEACANLGIVLHIEAAYETMWDIHSRGEPPRGFRVEPS